MRSDRTTGISPDEFLRNLGESGIVNVDEARAVLEALPAGNSDGKSLAGGLVGAGKLTSYQAEAILNRRFEELQIGNYEVLDRLGAGGMGAVYRARHRRMKRIVALKVLSKDVARTDTFVQRFQREVETIAQLNHPNIVMAYDADEAEVGPFLVMEFVNGRDLSSEVQKNGPLPAAVAVDAVLQAARGLEYAHSKGIIHRDIKPANLLRDASGTVKVADLGLARLADRSGTKEQSALTQAGGILGTLDYMAPEQAMDSLNIDHRVDVYSLGCTLYYLLVGRPVYEAPSLMALLLKHSAAAIPSLCEARPDLPSQLDAVFQQMVAKAPADRYQSMAQVVRALERLEGLSTISPAVVVAPRAAQTDPALAGATVDHGPQGQGLDLFGGQNIPMGATLVQPVPATRSEAAGLTIIVAEPSRTQAAIVRNYLQQLGAAAVHTTSSGQEALDLTRKNHAQVLVSALHLSDMTGVQLAQAVRADVGCRDAGFILLTSEEDAGEHTGLAAVDRAVLMYKPFDRDQLARSVGRATEKAPAQPQPAASATRRPADLVVVVVEPSRTQAGIVRGYLGQLGIDKTHWTGTGKQAIDMARQLHADVVLGSMHLPDMTGLEMAEALHGSADCAEVAVVLATSGSDADESGALRNAPRTVMMLKPFDPQKLAQALARATGVSFS
jgi:serine/threonine-protein kinase